MFIETEVFSKKNDSLVHFLDSLHYASILQQGILPKQRHFDRVFEESFVIYRPQQIVSGDFYWLSQVDNRIYLAVGDCTGHGVPGAMLSMLSHSLLGYIILNKKIRKTNNILIELDKKFIESFSSNMPEERFDNDWLEISLCCIDKDNKIIYFSGANRQLLHVSVNDNKAKLYKGSSYPLGGWQLEKERLYEAQAIPYEESDLIYLGTDGFQDQKGGKNGKRFSSKNLHKLIQSIASKPMPEQKKILEKTFLDWKCTYEQIDDVCIVGVKL